MDLNYEIHLLTHELDADFRTTVKCILNLLYLTLMKISKYEDEPRRLTKINNSESGIEAKTLLPVTQIKPSQRKQQKSKVNVCKIM